VVESWGDIDAAILPRSATKPIQALPFVESGAVERFGLGTEHVAMACASHNGEPRHVETVRAWLAKVGLGESDLECGAHAPRLPATVEALIRGNATYTNASPSAVTSHTIIRCSAACARR
jgi:L-asparaginase II